MLAKSRIAIKDKIIDSFLSMIFPLQEQIEEIYLFGSRSRDDWRPDSDYDVLIVLKKKDREIVSKLYDAVMEVLLDTGRLISLKIFTVSEFNRLKSIPTPFMASIMKEGIRLGNRN